MSPDLSGYESRPAPERTLRLVPSRFPPVGAFETVTAPEDLEAVFDLEGWTNDRLVVTRLSQLPRQEWVHGRPNASIVMAAFLHGSPGGLRFSGQELGAWYASSEFVTAVLEVANGLRKEISLSALARMQQTYRQYTARLGGRYVDIFGIHSEFHMPDDSSWPASQAFGRHVRDRGGALGLSGIRYESVRRPGHENWVCYRPPDVQDVVQGDHFEIDVPVTGSVVVRKLS